MVNGIIDESTMALPQETGVDLETLKLEKQMAKFARSSEFKLLKEHLLSRIEFYQEFYPDGRQVNQEIPTPEQWIIANAVIGEFKLVIGSFEQAAEVVKDAQQG
jgi:hypothetical protein